MGQERRNARFTLLCCHFCPPKAFRTSINSVRPMVDLRTEIAGVRLRNPTMLASGFLDETGGGIGPVYRSGGGGGGPEGARTEPRGGGPEPPTPPLHGRPVDARGPPDPR